MKNQLTKAVIITMVIICVTVSETISQTPSIIMQNNAGDYYGTLDFSLTDPPQAIGIGNFPNTVSPGAALHINTNTSMGTLFYNAGEVFRTDAPNAATYWKMYRGGSEFGRIFNNNDNHFYIQANDASGELRFNTGGTNTRMTILSGGNVGIGTATPAQKLSVDGNVQLVTSTNSYMIGSNPVLWHNNITNNIYVGVDAGSASVTGEKNTFVGFSTGNATTGGYQNTFVGNEVRHKQYIGHI
jgi:hypothetical protein